MRGRGGLYSAASRPTSEGFKSPWFLPFFLRPPCAFDEKECFGRRKRCHWWFGQSAGTKASWLIWSMAFDFHAHEPPGEERRPQPSVRAFESAYGRSAGGVFYGQPQHKEVQPRRNGRHNKTACPPSESLMEAGIQRCIGLLPRIAKQESSFSLPAKCPKEENSFAVVWEVPSAVADGQSR